MNRGRTEYQVAVISLKAALKRQGLTYRELAQRLRLSESGVKKIFTATDGSFQRIAQICRELGLSMAELLGDHSEEMLELSYSKEQQDYLVEHPVALQLYWLLVYERRPLPEAQSITGLKERECLSLLRKMDKLDLLDLLPGDRLRIPAVRQVRWVGDGPLIRKLYREWSEKFIRSVASPEPKEGQLFFVRYFRARRETAEELMEALRALEKEFVRRAIRDMRTEAPDLVNLRWLSAVDDKSFLD